MKTLRAIQYVECYPSRTAAEAGLDFLSTQDDYCGGRILPPTTADPRWRTQAFFETTPEAEAGMPLPDGCRVVSAIIGRCGFDPIDLEALS